MAEIFWGAERIDHRVRAIEDAALDSMLVDRQIPLGICPTCRQSFGWTDAMIKSVAKTSIDAASRPQTCKRNS